MDGPENITGVKRQAINFKNIALTDIVIEIPRYDHFYRLIVQSSHAARAPRQKTLAKAFTAADVQGKWEKTSWAKKRAARASRANLTDFDRFKVMVAKKKRNVVINTEARKLIKADNKKKATKK